MVVVGLGAEVGVRAFFLLESLLFILAGAIRLFFSGLISIFRRI